MNINSNDNYLNATELRELMNDRFSMDELNGLCHDLGLDWENVAGRTKNEKIIELIRFFCRAGNTDLLLAGCKKARAYTHWPDAKPCSPSFEIELGTSSRSFKARVVAFAVDCLILVALYLALTGLYYAIELIVLIILRNAISSPINTNNTSSIASAIGTVLTMVRFVSFLLLSWLYVAKSEASQYQGTFGKRLIGLKVTDLYGKRINLRTSTVRFTVKFAWIISPLAVLSISQFSYFLSFPTAAQEPVNRRFPK